MSPKQKKIAARAPPKDKIDAKDFAVLKAEKAKGRGMGLQDEKVKPGKVMKASKGGESKSDKLRKAFPKKTPESRAKIETMLGSKYTPMKKERLFEGDKARRREAFKKIIKNVRKAIPGVGMLDVKVTKKSKGGGADAGRAGIIKGINAVLKDKAERRLNVPDKTDIKKQKASVTKLKQQAKKSRLEKMKERQTGRPVYERMGGGMMKKYSKGGGADMGTKMSDKRKRRFKEILERLKSPTTINIKSEYKPGTRSPMQRDRKREGYRAKVESKGGKVLFMDEMKKGGSVMARGCKLGRKKATKLY